MPVCQYMPMSGWDFHIKGLFPLPFWKPFILLLMEDSFSMKYREFCGQHGNKNIQDSIALWSKDSLFKNGTGIIHPHWKEKSRHRPYMLHKD